MTQLQLLHMWVFAEVKGHISPIDQEQKDMFLQSLPGPACNHFSLLLKSHMKIYGGPYVLTRTASRGG